MAISMRFPVEDYEMKQPTREQLNDPAWWDENAPDGATHFARFPSGETEWQKRLPNRVSQRWSERLMRWNDIGPCSSATMTLRPTKPAAPEWEKGREPGRITPEWDGVAEEIFKDALWSMAPEWAEGFGTIKGKPVWFGRTQYAWVGVVGRNACRFDVSTNYQMTDITVMFWRTWGDTREQTIDAAVRLESSWMSARQFAEALYDAGMLRASGSEG